jgi:hypothetical protein
MRDFTLPRRYRLIYIAFNGFVHNLTTADQLSCLKVCRDHLVPGGSLVFNTFFPGLKFITGPEGTPILEHEATHPVTGLLVRIYDTRRLDRVEQVQYSQIEIQELDSEGRVMAAHRSQTEMRWTYKFEMELLLRTAGYQQWEIWGSFQRRPLTRDDDIMVVFAWREG